MQPSVPVLIEDHDVVEEAGGAFRQAQVRIPAEDVAEVAKVLIEGRKEFVPSLTRKPREVSQVEENFFPVGK
jgi:hypothetical protein